MEKARLEKIIQETRTAIVQDKKTLLKVKEESPETMALGHYLGISGCYPIYENTGCELYFSIFYKKDFDNPVLKKTFKDNGEIVTEKSNGDVNTKNGCTVNENNDFVITLEPEDTTDLDEGSYIYQIRALIIDKDVDPEEDENGELIYTYIINTVTNRLPIYIIEDDYNRRIW